MATCLLQLPCVHARNPFPKFPAIVMLLRTALRAVRADVSNLARSALKSLQSCLSPGVPRWPGAPQPPHKAQRQGFTHPVGPDCGQMPGFHVGEEHPLPRDEVVTMVLISVGT